MFCASLCHERCASCDICDKLHNLVTSLKIPKKENLCISLTQLNPYSKALVSVVCFSSYSILPNQLSLLKFQKHQSISKQEDLCFPHSFTFCTRQTQTNLSETSEHQSIYGITFLGSNSSI